MSRVRNKGSKPATRKHLENTYKSGLEAVNSDLLNDSGVVFYYEPIDGKIAYTIPSSTHVYTPDFVITTKSGKTIIVETKGIWTYVDRFKHLLVKQQHPELDIRFIFSKSLTRINKKASTTYRDICEGRGRANFKGITWRYADRLIPLDWLEE